MPKRPDTLETVQLVLEILKRIPRHKRVSAAEVHTELIKAGFGDQIKQFQSAVSKDPEALKTFATLKRWPCDLLGELKNVERSVNIFSRYISRGQHELWLGQRSGKRRLISTEPTADEVNRLGYINKYFEQIATHIDATATEIGQVLDVRLADDADRLWDYEMDAKMNFVLREDDLANSDESDNFLTELDLLMLKPDGPAQGWEIHSNDWPDESDPMPFGRIFRELLDPSDVTKKLPSVDMKDILRIGGVWCDLVVTYQFYYDITQGNWIKSFSRPEGERLGKRTYVQGKDGS